MRRTKKIGGPGLTVEIEESKFGKRKYNVGRLIEGQWVFGGICHETPRYFLSASGRSKCGDLTWCHSTVYRRRHDHNLGLLESLRLLRKRRL